MFVPQRPRKQIPSIAIFRVQFGSGAELPRRAGIVVFIGADRSQCHMSFSQLRVDGQGALGELLSALQMRQPGERQRIIRVRLESVLKIPARCFHLIAPIGILDQRVTSQVGVVGLSVLRVTMLNGLVFLRTELEV